MIDGDTLFFFNYRSDRMREIVTVMGLPDKPMEVNVPNDLVRLLAITDSSPRIPNINSPAHHDNVYVQLGISLPRCLSSTTNDKCSCRMSGQGRPETSSHCWLVFPRVKL
jgi:2,3-bisphosphoglycerate-independent phosphoglycerate mutase